MRMRRDDVRDWTRPRRLQNGLAVRGVVGTRIDDRKRRRADDICVRTLEGEGTGIFRDEARDARPHRRRLAVGERHISLEVEGIQAAAFRGPGAELMITALSTLWKEFAEAGGFASSVLASNLAA